jgi:starch synthase
MKTVFSIHNVEYQGMFGESSFDDFLGVPEEYRKLLRFGGGVNLMKGAIESAHMVSTVSPSYAEELKDPANAFGMDSVIRRNESKMKGILNGINTKLYDPEKDPYIAAAYSAEDLKGKKECKAALQKELGLPESDDMLITMVSRLVPAKGVDLLRDIMDDILDKNAVQFVMLGTGETEYEEFFRDLEERHPDKARSIIKFDAGLSHRIYAAGDVLLVPSRSEPCGLTQMIGCRYADIPLVRRTGGLGDSISDCSQEGGNGFVFDDYDPDSLRKVMLKAIKAYTKKKSWKKLAEHDMTIDFGWSGSASEYRDMYEKMYR